MVFVQDAFQVFNLPGNMELGWYCPGCFPSVQSTWLHPSNTAGMCVCTHVCMYVHIIL